MNKFESAPSLNKKEKKFVSRTTLRRPLEILLTMTLGLLGKEAFAQSVTPEVLDRLSRFQPVKIEHRDPATKDEVRFLREKALTEWRSVLTVHIEHDTTYKYDDKELVAKFRVTKSEGNIIVEYGYQTTESALNNEPKGGDPLSLIQPDSKLEWNIRNYKAADFAKEKRRVLFRNDTLRNALETINQEDGFEYKVIREAMDKAFKELKGSKLIDQESLKKAMSESGFGETK